MILFWGDSLRHSFDTALKNLQCAMRAYDSTNRISRIFNIVDLRSGQFRDSSIIIGALSQIAKKLLTKNYRETTNPGN